jgi:DTW domain-containing protein YfiP
MPELSILNPREKCYRCYRPQVSCMCQYINTVETKTKFVILMHPKEFKKTKNGSGRLTHLALPNSELFIGLDFSYHDKINELIENPLNSCYVLYPSSDSLVLNSLEKSYHDKKNLVIFLIDSTWACSKKILRLSKNLHSLPYMSFYHDRCSEFKIKEQPAEYCLSTMESTHVVLELLSKNGYETLKDEALKSFLNPFHKMIDFQLDKLSDTSDTPRFKVSNNS